MRYLKSTFESNERQINKVVIFNYKVDHDYLVYDKNQLKKVK